MHPRSLDTWLGYLRFDTLRNTSHLMKRKLVSKYDLVHIAWHDAAMHGTGQVTIDEAKDYGIMHGHISGWLVENNKEYVTIAMDFFPRQKDNEKDTFRTLQSYPKSGIDKMTVLKTLEIYEV